MQVLNKWKGYTGQHAGTQAFITQMVKIVGTEPLESSNGNQTLLSTYRVSVYIQVVSFCAT